MSDFGDLVLVLGDHHIPSRASDLPECFKELLSTDKIKTVLCTGNVGSKKQEESLLGIGSDVHIVRGEADPGLGKGINPGQPVNQFGGQPSATDDLPDSLVIEIGKFRVGLINGYQIIKSGGAGERDELALGRWQRKLGCDILVTGHSHKPDLFERNGKLFINPGTVSGAHQHYIGDCTTPVTETDAEGNQVRNGVW